MLAFWSHMFVLLFAIASLLLHAPNASHLHRCSNWPLIVLPPSEQKATVQLGFAFTDSSVQWRERERRQLMLISDSSVGSVYL